VLRIRYGLASVLARLGVRASWSQLIARHGVGPGGAEISGEITTWDADPESDAAPGGAPTAAGSGQVRAAAPPTSTSAPTSAPVAPPTFDVVLIDAGDRTIEIIREVRDLFGLGIREAKDLIDRAPRILKHTRDRDEAELLKRRLESSGGTVEIRTGVAGSD
jgi:large subunit ribosomal protein L7/L12